MKIKHLLLGLFLATSPAMAQIQPPSSPLPAISSTKIEAGHVFCSGSCQMFTAALTSGSVAGYWMIFDGNGIPNDGALTPQQAPKYCWYWNANTGNGYYWPGGIQFHSGLTMVYSTGTDCMHKTGSATAFFTVQVYQQ